MQEGKNERQPPPQPPASAARHHQTRAQCGRCVRPNHYEPGPSNGRDERSQQRPGRQTHDKGEGNEVARAHLARDLLCDSHLPKSIAEILPPQRSRCRAVVVHRPDRRIKNDPTSLGAHPITKLVIFVARHLLVKLAHPGKYPAPPSAHISSVRTHPSACVMEMGTAHAEWMTGGQ